MSDRCRTGVGRQTVWGKGVVEVLCPDSSEDDYWRCLTEQHFLAGHSDGDSIYDAV